AGCPGGGSAFSAHGSEINFFRRNNQKIYSAERAKIRINILRKDKMASGVAAARVSASQAAQRVGALREKIRAAPVRSEPEAVKALLETLSPVQGRLEIARQRATRWVEVARADNR